MLFFVSSFAFASGFRFRHISSDQGISSNRVRSLFQDYKGYIWIGTEDGLDRYDGIEFKTYRYDPSNKRSIGDNYISVLYGDDKQLIAGTDKGLFVYNYKTDNFTPLIFNGNKIESLINDIVKDLDGSLWICTNGNGVYRVNYRNNDFKHYEFSSTSGYIIDMLVDSDNKVWAITNQGKSSLYRLNKSTDEFEPIEVINDDKSKNSKALVMFEDSERNMWIGSWECGLQKFDPYTGKAITCISSVQGKGMMHIHSIMEYEAGKLLIGSDDGLVLFNTKTNMSEFYAEDETNSFSLSNRFVYPVIKDSEGGVWIGTYYGGVNYISPNNSQFECYSSSKFSNSVGGNVISNFCEDNSGNIWIASDDGGLSCFDPSKKSFMKYLPQSKNKNSLSYHNVHALCMDGDDLWIGTYTGGVNVYNTKTGKFRFYNSKENDENSLDGTSSYCIFKDRDNNIWVATMSGINLYDRENDNFIRIKDFNSLTIDIEQDTKGNLWFATQGKGVFKYNPYKRIWKNYNHQKGRGELPTDQINCITIDKSGNIWIATMDGLCKYKPSDDSFEIIELDIPSNNICSIVEDQSDLWLTTTKGLVKYTQGQRCQVFTKSDGLQCDQFLPNSAFKASDGKIYIGSVNGFNSFYPYQVHSNKVIPNVVFTGLEIFNNNIKVGTEKLPANLNLLDELDISYKDNVFSIKFASLSFCIPAKNQYAYKLQGFDKDWNYVGAQSKATYTNIPPGTYVFKVNATNNDGLWNENGASLKIVIHPPFYLSTPFMMLYFVIIAVGVFFLIRFFVKRSEKRHNIEIDRIKENKEKEVHEAKIHFFTMIAHEIRTPVSLITAPLEKIMTSSFRFPEAINEDLNIIDRNSKRLLFLVNQLLDFRKVEQEGFKLKCSLCNVKELITAVSDRFKPTIEQNGIKFEVELPDKEIVAIIDSEAITKLISNLLTNAKKYTDNSVMLSCKIKEEQHTFSISVKDNGNGISVEEQQKIFKPFYQAADNKPGTGIGLSIVRSIVEAHNGAIEVESQIGKGSEFIVTLPLENEGYVSDEEIALDETSFVPEDILSESHREVSNSKPMVLIVDDNVEMLNFLSVSLSEKYNIITAKDGVEALECIDKNEIAFIVSDWMMPVMNGVELCKAVRKNQATSHIPFVLLTAKTDINSKIEGMDCGADTYIEKPFSVQYLEACIKNLTDMRVLLRQKFSKMPLMPLNSIAGNSTDDKFLKQMNKLIEENFSNPDLSVDFLAEKLCISRSGLFAKIKTLANITPNELIQVVRLKKAATLLMENKYRINEICYMVGFNNPSYFSKCFNKQFGVKPGEFIENK